MQDKDSAKGNFHRKFSLQAWFQEMPLEKRMFCKSTTGNLNNLHNCPNVGQTKSEIYTQNESVFSKSKCRKNGRWMTWFDKECFGSMCKHGERILKSVANKLSSPFIDFPGYPVAPTISPRRELACNCAKASLFDERLQQVTRFQLIMASNLLASEKLQNRMCGKILP